MRKGMYFIGLFVLLLALSAAVRKPGTPEYAEGEVLVKFHSTTSAEAAMDVFTTLGTEPINFVPQIGVYHIKLMSNVTVAQAVDELNALPSVEYAEPNYIYTLVNTPNDPRYSELWGMQNSGQTGGLAGADISAFQAWDSSTGSDQVIVGVIDTGIDYTHEDLVNNIYTNPGEDAWLAPNDPSSGNGMDDDGNGLVDDWKGWNFINDTNDPYDDNMHGTHCAGTIGAVGNNNIGVVGVNWNVKLLPLKFLDSRGSGTTDKAINAIIYAADLGVDVLSNSWGGTAFSSALENAIDYANDKGVLFIAAAGNEGTDNDVIEHYPSNYTIENVVAVAASDHGDKRALWGGGGGGDDCGFICSPAVAAVPGSNYGKTTVDLAAPGKDILSTVPGNRYGVLSGTSMATPHVAGAAALVLSVNPNLTMAEQKAALLGSVDVLDDFTNKLVTGGRLNVAAAVQSVTPAP